MKKLNLSDKRNLKYGTVATAITIGFIALILVVNVIATILLNRFPLSVDLTSSGKYEVSQETIDFVQEIDEDINIYILFDEIYFTDPNLYFYETGDSYQLGEIMRRYTQYNSRINISYIDLATNPSFSTKYPNETLSRGDVIVESSTRYQKFILTDMFNITTDSTGTQLASLSSKAEEKMTSALLFVTDENPAKVVLTSGHNEADVSALTNLLNQNGYVTETVATLGAEIDPEAQVVIIPAPSVDFTDSEINKLEEFLNNGGAYGKQVFFMAAAGQPELANLEAFLADWGIGLGDGSILETDPDKTYLTAWLSIQDGDSIDYDFLERDPLSAPVVMPYVRPVEALFEAQNLRTTTVLCSTYDTSVLYPNEASDDWSADNETKQVFNTVVAGQRQTDTTNYDEVAFSTVIAFGSVDMFNTDFLNSSSFGNGQFSISLVNKLTEKENLITIVPKDLKSLSLDINATTAVALGVIFIAVLPVAILVVGVVVFLRRRHL